MNYKIELSSEEVPKKWYNINADLPCELPMPKIVKEEIKLKICKKHLQKRHWTRSLQLKDTLRFHKK